LAKIAVAPNTAARRMAKTISRKATFFFMIFSFPNIPVAKTVFPGDATSMPNLGDRAEKMDAPFAPVIFSRREFVSDSS
jgi:hypothetical protein